MASCSGSCGIAGPHSLARVFAVAIEGDGVRARRFPAGAAGCLFGFISLIVEPGTFGLTLGIGTVAASVLGGTESVYGIFIGAAILQLGPEKSVNFASWAPVLYGGFLIVAAILLK